MKSLRLALKRQRDQRKQQKASDLEVLYGPRNPYTHEATPTPSPPPASGLDFELGYSPVPSSTNPRLYEPIQLGNNEIRILSLLPGLPGSKMQLLLRREFLASRDLPEYEALSYAWGDAELTRMIWVNDKVMAISRNLESALETLRHPKDPRKLWVDAICIDQGNVQERNRQVAVMRSIYRKALRVLIWLGEEKPDSDLAFDMIERLSANADERKSTHVLGEEYEDFLHRSRDCLSRGTFIEEIPEKTMAALRDIFSHRGWWSRIWVIQEVRRFSHFTSPAYWRGRRRRRRDNFASSPHPASKSS
jgi:hypothetical protein